MANLFKRLADAISPKPQMGVESGTTGTPIFGGIITSDFNNDLQFPNSVKEYDKMRRTDGTIAGILEAMKMPLLSAKWFIKSGGTEADDDELRDFANYVLFKRMNFKGFLREALGYLDFGFSYFEKVFEVDEDSNIVWKKLAPRTQTAHYLWGIQGKPWVDGFPAGITQTYVTTDENNQDGKAGIITKTIPWDKLVLFTNRQEGNNFEGISLLRPVYKHWYYKDLLYKISGISCERFGVGIPWAKLKASANKESEAKIEEFLKNIRSNEQAYFRATTDVEDWGIKTPDGSMKEGQITELISHHDRKIYDAILAGFLNLTSGEGGSNALSKDQSSFFLRSLQFIADYITGVLNAHLKELIDLNFQNVEEYPELAVTDIGSISMDEAINALVSAKNGGLVDIVDTDKDAIRETLKLPPLTDKQKEEVAVLAEEAKAKQEEIDAQALVNPAEAAKQAVEGVKKEMSELKYMFKRNFRLGGEGSGNFGHEGRPGERGGSGDGGGSPLHSASHLQGVLGSQADYYRAAGSKTYVSSTKSPNMGERHFIDISNPDKSVESAQSRDAQARLQKLGGDIRSLNPGAQTYASSEISPNMGTRTFLDVDMTRTDGNEALYSEKTLADAKKKALPSARERNFISSITQFERFLESEYETFDGILSGFEDRYRAGIKAIYNAADTERKDGVVSLLPNKALVRKAKSFVTDLTKKLEDKLVDSGRQRAFFKKTKSMAVAAMGEHNKMLADKIDVDEGMFNSFVGGYISNVQGVIFNDPRRIMEAVEMNFGSKVSLDLAVKSADSISFNRNIFKLSTVTHARGAFKSVVFNEAANQGFTMYKVVVPKNRLSDIKPSGVTGDYLFTIATMAMINKWRSEETDGQNADSVKGLGLHHGSYEYYYPIESDNLDEEEEIADEQRQEWLDNYDVSDEEL